VLVAALLLAAFFVLRATRLSRQRPTCFTPIDGERAIFAKADGKEIDVALVDERGRAVWSQVVPYADDVLMRSPMDLCAFGVDPEGDVVTVGAQVGLDLRDGHERWRRAGDTSESAASHVRMLRLDGGQVLQVIVHEAGAPAVVALDAASGDELWRMRADTGGGIRFYRLFDELLLLAGERVTLVDRRTGLAVDAGIADPGRLVCAAGGRAFWLAANGAMWATELGARTSRVLAPELGPALCPSPCRALTCATHGDEVVLATNQRAGEEPLPTTVRIASLDATTLVARWQLEVKVLGAVHANSSNSATDFLPLRDVAPRYAPFRVGGELVVVDLERHEEAWRAPGRRSSNGWRLQSAGGRVFVRDADVLALIDGDSGKVVASVRFPVSLDAELGTDRVWLHGMLFSEGRGEEVVGQLDARDLGPRPGSERLVLERVEGGWVSSW
jgi:putative pyrroloquinoline-quinone binding quinoprotein